MRRLRTSLSSPARAAATGALTAALAAASVVVPAAATAAAPSHNPGGHLDSVNLVKGTATYRGWAVDPDVVGIVRIVVALDGTPVSSALANLSRPDIAKTHRGVGPNRGFAGTINLPAGVHRLCFTAGDLAAGSDTALGCVSLSVPVVPGLSVTTTKATYRPVGVLESATYGKSTLSVHGWTIDPGTWAATDVDVMINGNSFGSTFANVVRADIGKSHPGYGSRHGFALAIPTTLAPGNYEICAVAVNTAAGGNTILPCSLLTVLPVGVPSVLNVGAASDAAAALQAQAIASGAASAASFPAGATSAARIALATRALLHQAAGLSAAPRARAGVPKFVRASATKVVDEQAVMGPTQSLSSYPAQKTGGRPGAARALTTYANDPTYAPGGTGDGVVGAAPILPANGVTVHPAVPGYPAGYTRLRAEIAIDNALVHLGDPYVWAAAGPSTFDCSGLTQWAYAAAGVSLYHYTGSQAVQGVRVMPNQLLPGDLVLFGSDLHHVGMYLGAGYMIDAPYTGAYVRVDKVSWFGDFSLAVRP